MKNRFTPFLLIAGCFLLISGTIDLNELFNYADQSIPNYINKDNTPLNNELTDPGATLGRVLFYDKNLSVNNTISCASCHQQEFAFGDTARVSVGVAGVTGRHSMRLINARFANEGRFFWDERTNSLEQQTTMPIQDHVEMGFSGTNGDPDLDSLIRKLEAVDYYQELFTFVYGSPQISEGRMRRALAQFVRSIQSYDSKYDEGRAMVGNNNAPFPNFTQQENLGKNLFSTPPPQGGAGCQGCHRAPEFDIDPNSRNNGVTGVVGDPMALDIEVTRSPSLRDIINPNGFLNGPLMHNGAFNDLLSVINHYDSIAIDTNNTNLDPRLRGAPGGPGGPPPAGQNLQLTQDEKEALVAFLRTLTGSDVYTNEKWSDPFDENGELTIVPFCGDNNMTVLNVEICEGETYENYSQSGVYEDLFINVFGCDSTRVLNLFVLPNAEEIVEATFCEGEDYEGYELPGTYLDEFVGSNGCDSLRILILDVLPVASSIVGAEICDGEEYEGYFETGVYTDFFTAANGCDSIRILELDVLPADDPNCSPNATGDVLAENEVAVSPNPFNDYLNIQCECNLELNVEIYSVSGKKLKSLKLDFTDGNARLITNNLLPGIYLMIGFDEMGNKYFTKKLIKS